jgi:hypothetical protein
MCPLKWHIWTIWPVSHPGGLDRGLFEIRFHCTSDHGLPAVAHFPSASCLTCDPPRLIRKLTAARRLVVDRPGLIGRFLGIADRPSSVSPIVHDPNHYMGTTIRPGGWAALAGTISLNALFQTRSLDV